QALRTFRLARVQAVEALGIPRASYPDFHLPAYWQETRARLESRSSFLATVRADADLASEILSRPYTVLQSTRLPDSSLEAKIDFEYQGAAIAFALQFGARVEIVAPESVRNAIVSAA